MTLLVRALSAGLVAVLLAIQRSPTLVPAAADRFAGSERPRTPDGQPDLQGTWTNATLTPLERRQRFRGAVMTERGAAGLERAFQERQRRLAEPSDPNRPPPAAGDDVGTYNSFWNERGERVARVHGRPRRSLIVDPPNGLIPARTPLGQQRLGRLNALRARHGEFSHPELRPLQERCLELRNVGPPMVPNYAHNNNYQIAQTKEHVAIQIEMINDVRIIRLGGEHPPAHLRFWYGDSIGWWRGDTLQVETTNFHPLQTFEGSSENLKVLEWYRMVGPDTLLYRFTVFDPDAFSREWSGEVPFTRTTNRIYEYACHEGNYSLENILRGARAQEREANRR